MHNVRVQHTAFVHDIAVFDPRGFDDELFRGMRFRFDLACGDGLCVFGVELVGIGVEGFDQFCVADRL